MQSMEQRTIRREHKLEHRRLLGQHIELAARKTFEPIHFKLLLTYRSLHLSVLDFVLGNIFLLVLDRVVVSHLFHLGNLAVSKKIDTWTV